MVFDVGHDRRGPDWATECVDPPRRKPVYEPAPIVTGLWQWRSKHCAVTFHFGGSTLH